MKRVDTVFDPSTAAIIVIALVTLLLVSGAHIGVALGLGGILGMYLTIGHFAAMAQLATVPFSTTNSFTLAVIPLFILMGSLATQARLTNDLYSAAYNWVSRLPGGLAMTTTLASAAFGAASGSTIVNAAVFTKMAMPEMTKLGYDKRLSAGCIAASGTLAAMIPPSILMVIYALVTEQSVGLMLVAGLVPGILTAVVFLIGIYIIAKRRLTLRRCLKTRSRDRRRSALSRTFGASFFCSRWLSAAFMAAISSRLMRVQLGRSELS